MRSYYAKFSVISTLDQAEVGAGVEMEIVRKWKAFLDRTYSYLLPDFRTNPQKSRLSPGKKLVFILAQNNPDRDSFKDIFPKFDYFFKAYGFVESHLIRAFGVSEPGEVQTHEDVMKLAEKTAETICGCS